jgi:malate dehydrogenase (oxaloacetate-decarboxylating)(NADP+)
MMNQPKTGADLLQDARLNKSTAFNEQERKNLHLEGLLPASVETEDMQIRRVMQQLGFKSSDLERYIFLMNLLDHDETLFYKILMSDPARFLPIVYDPTVGEACLKFGHIFRQPRGMYLNLRHKGSIKSILKNWPVKDIRFICATSGGRILGLGDLGANGMGIPIGKLQLYTACAAVPPQHLLPMHIDLGTTNESLLHDPLYLGLKQPRVSTKELDEFVDEFVHAVQEVFPDCCIHFEDWAGVDAMRLLAKYKDKVSCYNDDIQGTAGAALAGIYSALRITKKQLKDQKILFLGAGSAGIGIANLIVSSMQLEGLSEQEARSRIALFDIHGLLQKDRKDLFDFQKPYAHALPASHDFVSCIEMFKPTAIIGVSTQGKTFTKQVVEAMCHINSRPIIFALSNPTSCAECSAQEAYMWSNGKALYAAGVPFAPVRLENKTFFPSQGNNLYIFPAIGLAAFATKATRITDEMFATAAKACANLVTEQELDSGLLYPPQTDILKTEIAIATHVAELIFNKGFAKVPRPKDIKTYIESIIYKPEYRQTV